MKALMLFCCVAFCACTPSADNDNASAVAVPDSDDDKNEPNEPTPSPTPIPTSTPEDPGKEPDSPVKEPESPVEDPLLKNCNNASGAGSAYPMDVQLDEVTGKYRIDFKKEAHRQLHLISLYVTGKDDSIPIFPKFEFNGTAYWMINVDNPFDDEYFVLPVTYGKLRDKATDVTQSYGGLPGGARLSSLTVPTCIKISVITFEPDADVSFKTSSFLQVYRP